MGKLHEANKKLTMKRAEAYLAGLEVNNFAHSDRERDSRIVMSTSEHEVGSDDERVGD